MVIKNEKAFRDGAINWDCVAKSFPGPKRIPGDLDGILERKGQFLVFEVKAPGAPLPLGQRLTFEAMARNGSFTVFVIWGKKKNPVDINSWLVPEEMDVYSAKHIKGCGRHKTNLKTLQHLCKTWWENVENGKLP